MSALVDRAIRAAGLDDVLVIRAAGGPLDALVERLRGADLLVLGALADRVRAEEVGPEVRIYVDDAPSVPPFALLPAEGSDATGLDLLRQVALARTLGPKRARVRVDWVRSGLELAQVALGFGADELVGRLATKRGLPIDAGDLLGVGKKSRRESAHSVKQKELSGYVRRAGRVALFIGPDGRPEWTPKAGVEAQEAE